LSSGAEDDGAFSEVTADNSKVTCVVFRWILLFIGRFMFLIDDNEPGVFDGCKNGGASPNYDTGFSSPDSMPFVEALALGEVRVKDCDLIGEIVKASFEALDGLGSK
jgi:hypothetical protein